MRHQARRANTGRRPLVRRVLQRLGAAAIAGGTAIATAVLVYRPWGWRWHVPFSLDFDNQLNAIFVRNILSGTVYSTDRLGAPFGQHLQDFPAGGDRWSYLAIRSLGTVWHDPYTVLNAYFILGFGLIAASAYLVARELELRPLPAGSVALLSAFLPYHLLHGETHIWLASYAGQPLAVLLAVWIVRDEVRLPFLHRRAGAWTSTQKHRAWIVAAAVVMLGGNGGYYAAFSIFLFVGMGVIAQARRRSWSTLSTGLVLAGGVAGVLILNLTPELLWRARYGVDHAVAFRTVAENDTYALRLTRLILPDSAHRIGAFAAAGRRTVGGEGAEYAGLLAIVGLLSAWWALLRRGLSHPDSGNEPAGDSDTSIPLPIALGVITVFLVLLGTAGGLGALGAAAGLTQFRAWARVAIPLALSGLLSLGWFLQRRFLTAPRPRWSAFAAAALVVALGLFDQIPRGVTPHFAANRDALAPNRVFVEEMERSLPRDAMVFQLPVMSFPEHGPVWRLPDYDLALPYILGRGELRWSYGGVRGREADWQTWWSQQPLEPEIRGVAAAGYDALYIDCRAYPDDGATLLRSLEGFLGQPAAHRANLAWFDLRPMRAALEHRFGVPTVDAVGRQILHSVLPDFGGQVTPDGAIPGQTSRWIGSHMQIRFANSLDRVRIMRVTWKFTAPAGTEIRATGPGIRANLTFSDDAEKSWTFSLRVPAHASAKVTFDSTGPGIPNLGLDFAVLAHMTGMRFDEAAVRAVTIPRGASR